MNKIFLLYPCLLLYFLFQPANSHAQSDGNITGTWQGYIKVPLSDDLLGVYQFIQDGNTLKGDLKSKTLSGKDSSDLELLGTVDNGKLHFRTTRIIYKTTITCLSITDLVYSRENGKEILTGKWHGDWSLETCPAAWSGKIELYKKESPEPTAQNRSASPQENVTASSRTSPQPEETVQKNDTDGEALIQALSKRKYYALIIGIDNYADKNIEHLDNPVRDATDLKNVLISDYTFEPANIVFLANPTRTQIIDAFDKLSREITDIDQLLIFYAGHGIWDEQLNQGYWLPADASLNSKAQWLSNGTIRDYIGGIKSKHTLLVTDACFSGSIFKERGVSFVNSKAILEMYKLPSRKAMTSGAMKTVPDKSVFVKYLIKDLSTNDQPLLSAEQLFQTFKVAVINNSPNGQVPQFGPIAQAGDEGGDFIFLKKGSK